MKDALINGIRNKLDMGEPKDVEVWDTLMDIASTPYETLVKEMTAEMTQELVSLEEQIDTFEKMRIKHLLTNEVLTKQAAEILVKLRTERDELKQTLQSKAYQGLDGRPGSQPLDTRRRT